MLMYRLEVELEANRGLQAEMSSGKTVSHSNNTRARFATIGRRFGSEKGGRY